MSKQLKAIMERPVTRRQFLTQLGLVLIALLGFNSVLSILTKPSRQIKLSSGDKASHGFGAGKFGD